eukprot:TRINITY_DN121389_c0_g1_i1.p1 TRINITY_DN121389_c0_g1~~TRINITY_DN121389_c0_g1_i1.p1  ORF type:complete len:402 (-),score=2.67 TRINITY_DN121389_c0_g1_i1:163-1368(-)
MIFIFYLCLISAYIATAEWTVPVKVGEAQNQYGYSGVTDMYLDPSTDTSHVVYRDDSEEAYYYSAILSDGTVAHTSKFTDWKQSSPWRAVIKGNGKRLFIALRGSRTMNDKFYFDVNFTESYDGGISWIPMIQTPKRNSSDNIRRFIGDMVYIKETGRLFLFYWREDGSVWTTTRAPGSSIFNIESPIAAVIPEWRGKTIIAAYGYKANKIMLHVFIANKTHLLYVRSLNNGLTWLPPRVVVNGTIAAILNVEVSSNVPSIIALAYNARLTSSPNMLIVSKDYGDSFSDPIQITQNNASTSANQTAGLKICGTNEHSFLASFFITDTSQYNSEYAFWDLSELTPIANNNVFDKDIVSSVGMDCTSGSENIKVTAVIGKKTGEWVTYMFAKDIIPILGQENN